MVQFLKNKFRDYTTDSRFSEIIIGSSWVLAARLITAAFTLLTSIIVARIYGAEMVGILAMIQALLLFTTIFTVLGTNTSILRLIPEYVTKYSVTSAFKVYRKTQYFVGVISLFTGVIIFFSSNAIATNIFNKPHLDFYITLTCVIVIFRSLMELNTQAVRGLRLMKAFSFMQILPSAVTFLTLVAITILHGGQNSAVYAQMVAWVLTALVGTWVVHHYFHKMMLPQDELHPLPLGDILRISTPMLLTSSMQLVIGQTGVILLGIFRTETEVGYYAVAVSLATLTSLILQSINSIAAPKFSDLYHKGAVDELIYVARKSTKLIFWVTTPILLMLLLVGIPLLGTVFGQEFTVAYPALAFLIIGQFINSISGSTGIFMNMTGNHKVLCNVMVTAGLANIALNWLLVPIFGINGAAFSGMIILVSWNLYILSYITRQYGKTIGYLPFLLGN